MKIFRVCFIIGMLVFINGSLKAEDQSLNYCAETFWKEKKCPNDRCYLGCVGGIEYEGCPISCEMKPCLQISAEQCPLNRCQVLKGCDEEDVCYPQFANDTPECGDLAYAGQAVECCEGFVKRCGVEFFDGSCDMEGKYTLDSVPICLPCGNGICNQFENRCNCPEDCLEN